MIRILILLNFFLLFITAVQDSGACICSNLSGGGETFVKFPGGAKPP